MAEYVGKVMVEIAPERLLAGLIERLPAFDGSWEPVERAEWWGMYNRLLGLAERSTPPQPALAMLVDEVNALLADHVGMLAGSLAGKRDVAEVRREVGELRDLIDRPAAGANATVLGEVMRLIEERVVNDGGTRPLDHPSVPAGAGEGTKHEDHEAAAAGQEAPRATSTRPKGTTKEQRAEIGRRVADGQKSAAIAREMGIPLTTVCYYATAVRKELKGATAAQAGGEVDETPFGDQRPAEGAEPDGERLDHVDHAEGGVASGVYVPAGIALVGVPGPELVIVPGVGEISGNGVDHAEAPATGQEPAGERTNGKNGSEESGNGKVTEIMRLAREGRSNQEIAILTGAKLGEVARHVAAMQKAQDDQPVSEKTWQQMRGLAEQGKSDEAIAAAMGLQAPQVRKNLAGWRKVHGEVAASAAGGRFRG